MKNKRIINYIDICLYALLISVYIFDIYSLLRHGRKNIDSDMSAELMLANLLNKHHELLLCKDWLYSTEIRVVYLQTAYRIGLLLFPNNWFYARVFGQGTMLIVYVLAFIHLCKTIGIKRYGVAFAIVLLLPISWYYYENVILGASYLPHLILYILLTDLMIMYIKKKDIKLLIAIITLGILGGLNGIRIIYNYAFVLASLVLIILFIYDKPKKVKEFINILFNKYKIVIIEIISIFIGYFINVVYFRRVFEYANYTASKIANPSFEAMLNIIEKFFNLFGWYEISALINGNLLSLFSLIPMIYIIVCFLVLIIKRKDTSFINNKIHICFLIVVPLALLELLLIFNLTGQNKSRYWIPLLPYILIEFGIIINNFKNKAYKYVGVSLLLLSMICTSINATNYYVKLNNDECREELVEYLLDNDLTQGFASFWSSNILTELSNGQIDMWISSNEFSNSDKYEIISWLQEVRHKTEEPTGKTFLIINSNHDEIDTSNIDDYKTYQKGIYTVYVFDDFNQIKEFMNTRKVS